MQAFKLLNTRKPLMGAFPSGLVLSNEEMVTQPLQLAAFKVQRQVSGEFEVPTTLS
jgi:hypothetical protein